MPEEFYQELIEAIKKNKLSKNEITRKKLELCKKYKIGRVPSDIQVLLHAPQQDISRLKLVTKPVRTISGVATIALMTFPFACKHGKCIYCPGGPGSVFGDVPQSYTGKEPSTMRAIRNFYDPYLIVFNRLEQYIATGHSADKVEMIIQGGTFPSFEKKYQEDFITYALKGLNDFGEIFFPKEQLDFDKYKEFFEMPGEMKNAERVKRIQQRELELKQTSTLEKEQLKNETAKFRCVALCIETKPDWCLEPHINMMLKLGTTRVELGVQNLKEKIMKITNRGHNLKDVIKATQLMKDSFLKSGYHMMPGLPETTKEEDISMMKELFENQNYMPDSLKIYPTAVIRGTPLYELWKRGKYKPITVDDASDIIAEAKRNIPIWCRLMRVQRDIPSTVIETGSNVTNLRQLVEKKCKQKGIKCRCIRCREPKERITDAANAKIYKEIYQSSNGTEIFLSAEDRKADVLLGFCRLRIPFKPFRPEINARSAGIRELHVYGTAVPVGEIDAEKLQHRGLGKELMKEAEKTAAEEYNAKKMLVISGIGVREYYYKLGYKKDGVYVSKQI